MKEIKIEHAILSKAARHILPGAVDKESGQYEIKWRLHVGEAVLEWQKQTNSVYRVEKVRGLVK